MEEESVEHLSLIDFGEVWQTSVEVGDCRHLWDWLVYNGYVISQKGVDNV